MSKTGVIVIETPDPPTTTDNASTDSTTETQTSTDGSDDKSKPGNKDKSTS